VSGKQITNHQGLEDSLPTELGWPPGQCAVLVKTREDLIEAVRLQVKEEVDAIKVSGSNDNLITPDALGSAAFTFEEFKTIADETHRLGKLSTVHARSCDAARDAARAGFDMIFHASYIDDAGIEACLANECVINPTLTLLVNLLDASQGRAGASGLAAFQREVDAAARNLRRAYDLADVLVVPGDPTKDIRLLQRPKSFDYVFKGGAPVDRTPQPERVRRWYERQKTFLAGLWVYDEETGQGNARPVAMTPELAAASHVPLPEQVYQQLRRAILNGVFAPSRSSRRR